MIVTIDGPSGVGKSSTARELARRLGFDFLDTGAMYRAVALATIRSGLSEESDLDELLTSVRIEWQPGRITLDGEDVGELIRSDAVTAMASRLAARPAVRRFLVAIQRRIGDGRNLITEGRDQGTVVFPNAECKFFLVADAEERARRRHRELAARGDATPFDELLASLLERDRRDASRYDSPTAPADDAMILDTTHQSFEQVLETLESAIRRCHPDTPPQSMRSPTGPSIWA